MPSFEVRPFRRGDRDQLTALVKSHASVVMPGASVSVNTVLQQLEREPDEFIVGPWMSERITLVAEQDGSIVAAALVVRYRADADVGEGYRNAGDIRWLLFRPLAPAGNPWYTHPEEEARLAFLAANGFQEITRCRKGWALPAQGTITARPVTLPS